jgi:hypothetical protein
MYQASNMLLNHDLNVKNKNMLALSKELDM